MPEKAFLYGKVLRFFINISRKSTESTNRVETERSSGALSFEEISRTAHSITPSFQVTDKFDRLKWGFKAELPVSFGSSSSKTYSKEWKIATVEYDDALYSENNSVWKYEKLAPGYDSESSSFGIGLNAAVGASYPVVEGRFAVNAGLGVKLLDYSRSAGSGSPNGSTWTETERAENSKGEVAESFNAGRAGGADYAWAQDEWKGVSGAFSAGFTFSFNKQFVLDCGVSVSGSNGFNVSSLAGVSLAMKF